MIQIRYPEPEFRTRIEKGRAQIFDPVRQQWIVLQPEEWVRQNFMQWLIREAHIPASAIAVEKKVDKKQGAKRFDLLIYDPNTAPWMMVELKATEVKLDEAVLMQVLAYTVSTPVPFLAISNGKECYVAARSLVSGGHWLSEFPAYPLA